MGQQQAQGQALGQQRSPLMSGMFADKGPNLLRPGIAGGLGQPADQFAAAAGGGGRQPALGKPPGSSTAVPASFNALLGGSAEEELPPTAPEPAVSDRIHFIINNLANANLDGKVAELKSFLKEEHALWLGNYLVVKRVSTQPNFHQMYFSFVEKLCVPAVEDSCLKFSLQNVRKLLRSEKITTSTSERSLLKNLGHWLGLMTVARGRPLLHLELDVKELLLLAYETGRLIVVVPFVAKVLEGCKDSRVFRPPNPWTMGLMGVLHEVYDVPDLKLNIKFEIEVLCNALKLKLPDLKLPYGSILSSRHAPEKSNNPDFAIKTLVAPTPQAAGPEKARGEAREGAEGAPHGQPAVTSGSFPEGFQETTVIPNLAAYVSINVNLTLFNQHPHLKRVVPVAVDRAIREIIQPVVERSVTIACITSRELVMKDFAMEPDENKMRKAAHLMVSNLAGSLALVTCKEPLRVSMGNHLRTLLAAATTEQTLVEQVVQVCSAENLELGCMLIEKAATEKAMRDIDDGLAPALTARRKHREQTGQPFYDMTFFQPGSRYPSALPEPLLPKRGGLQPQHLLVYEAFQRQWQPMAPTSTAEQPGQPQGTVGQPGRPGAPPAAAAAPGFPAAGKGPGGQFGVDPSGGAPGGAPGAPVPQQQQQQQLNTSQSLDRYNSIMSDLEQALLSLTRQSGSQDINLPSLPQDHPINNLLRELRPVEQATQPQHRDEAVLAFAQKVFKRMYELQPRNLRLALAVMAAVLETCCAIGKKLKKELTSWVIYSPQDGSRAKMHREIVFALIRQKLLQLADFDHHTSRAMDGGRNQPGVQFAMLLVKQCVVTERIMAPAEFPNTLDALAKLCRAHNTMELRHLLDEVRAVASSQPPPAAAAPAAGGAVAAKGADGKLAVQAKSGAAAKSQDPAGMRTEVTYLLEHWIRIWSETPGSEKAYASYLSLLQQQGVLKSEENSERFFRITTELCVESCFNTAATPELDAKGRPKLRYDVIDAFCKLIVLLVKYAEPVQNNSTAKIALLSRVLGTISRVLINDYSSHCESGTQFDQRTYFRFFVNLLQDLNSPDPVLDSSNFQVLTAFSNCLHSLQPSTVPGFAFAWLELVSHRMFMPNLLNAKQHKGWPPLQRLVVDLFRFMEPHLRTPDMNDAIRLLYKGTLRVLLVLLHDFPEFLCEFHFSFCDVIPPSCIQLRNLILSAFPRTMRLPDPFTPNLKVDLLPEITQPPRLLSNYQSALVHNQLKQDIDQYLKMRNPPKLLQSLSKKLLLPHTDSTTVTQTINAAVLHVGVQALAQLQSKSGSITNAAPMDIFQQLANDLSVEGRYLFLNAIANQLRYPNNHTHYFSCVLLYLFAEATQEIVQEQITRVLLERLIVHRPHPWGLLITFIELIKNPRYNFWRHDFTRCAPEIERLFESVARSCMGTAGGDGDGAQEDASAGSS
jgi:CCR4-NOT transcription complex subunit 1